ncbi:MAG: hypothetical protein NTV33_11765 [Coprothermobacterota bacterium]|nr:hypothetical protein [Coprothermobacterota bacterium]
MAYYQTEQQSFGIWPSLITRIEKWASFIASSREIEDKYSKMSTMIAGPVSELRQKYQVGLPNEKQVLDYLWDHPELIKTLQPLVKTARESLGDQVQILLQIWDDPIDRHLELVIRKSSYANILQDLDPLIEQSVELQRGAPNWIHVTTDYVRI